MLHIISHRRVLYFARPQMGEDVERLRDACISGDTRPCEALETLGRSAELVIHEANFEDSMIELAELKKHSTTR